MARLLGGTEARQRLGAALVVTAALAAFYLGASPSSEARHCDEGNSPPMIYGVYATPPSGTATLDRESSTLSVDFRAGVWDEHTKGDVLFRWTFNTRPGAFNWYRSPTQVHEGRGLSEVTHTYTEPGEYRWQLDLTDACGEEKTYYDGYYVRHSLGDSRRSSAFEFFCDNRHADDGRTGPGIRGTINLYLEKLNHPVQDAICAGLRDE